MKLQKLDTVRGKKYTAVLDSANASFMISASGHFKVFLKNSAKKTVGTFIQSSHSTLTIPRNQGIKYVVVENLDLVDFNVYLNELEF
jgi:hypothetical protein